MKGTRSSLSLCSSATFSRCCIRASRSYGPVGLFLVWSRWRKPAGSKAFWERGDGDTVTPGLAGGALALTASASRGRYLWIHLGQLVLQLIQLLGAEALEDGVLVDVPGVRHGR